MRGSSLWTKSAQIKTRIVSASLWDIMMKRAYVYTFLELMLIVLSSAINEEPEVKVKLSNDFPVVGSNIFITCFVVESAPVKAANLYFTNYDGDKIQPSDRIKFGKEFFQQNGTTIIYATVENITVKDGDEKGIKKCYFEKSKQSRFSHDIRYFVLPKNQVPAIQVQESAVTAKLGQTLQMSCTVKFELGEPIKNMSVEWKFKTAVGSLPNGTKFNNKKVNVSFTQSTLDIAKVQAYHGGKYFCVAILHLQYRRTSLGKFNKVVDIDAIFPNSVEKEEEKVKAGDDVTFDCSDLVVYPVPTLSWKKGDDIITAASDKRYKFSPASSTHPSNSKFTIIDVTYTDRSKFTCVSAVGNRTQEKVYNLRVRDPLGALWPFIGIVVEAVLLVIIIVVYEIYKKRSRAKKDEKDGGLKETSPLVKPSATPAVSYTTGDGVRSRVSFDEKA